MKFGTGRPPEDLLDTAHLKHTDRRVLSPIDLPLWDRAKWRATLFACARDVPPVLALVFVDGEAGQAIFRAWRQEWGQRDEKDALRIAVVRGLSTRNPAEYAVIVGPNIARLKDYEGKTFILVSRVNRMVPTNTVNLDMFLAAYQRYGAFFLAPARMGSPAPTLYPQWSIGKQHLVVRQAWQISENDPDGCALQEDDEPIVPPDVTHPPVEAALLSIRSRRREARRGSDAGTDTD